MDLNPFMRRHSAPPITYCCNALKKNLYELFYTYFLRASFLRSYFFKIYIDISLNFAKYLLTYKYAMQIKSCFPGLWLLGSFTTILNHVKPVTVNVMEYVLQFKGVYHLAFILETDNTLRWWITENLFLLIFTQYDRLLPSY